MSENHILDDFSDSFPPYGREEDFKALKNEFERRFGKQDFSAFGLDSYSIENYGRLYDAILNNSNKTNTRMAAVIVKGNEEETSRVAKLIGMDKIVSSFLDKGFLKQWKVLIQEDEDGFYLADYTIGKHILGWNEIDKILSGNIPEFERLGNSDKERVFLKALPNLLKKFDFKIHVEGSKNWFRKHMPYLQGKGWFERKGMDLYFKHEPLDRLVK